MKTFTCIKLLLVTCFFSAFSHAFGQAQSNYHPNKVISPSPTASSLGVYGDLSVGYYSGTPDINIPLYEVKTPNNSLFIRMQYNASGIRVSENAGWVGLGWSLSAGGVITRTIRGKDDFSHQGYYTAGALPAADGGNNYNSDPNNPAWGTDKQYFDAIREGHLDGEPDIFTYNFDNYSGKLALGKQTNGSPIFMSERNNLKVEYLPATFNWKITNSNGYIYYFGTKEWTRDNHTYSSDATQIEADAPLNKFTYSSLNAGDNITAWYLDSIVSPTSEAIRFYYTRRGESFGLVNTSEKVYNLRNTQVLTETGTCKNSVPDFIGTYKSYNASKPTLLDVYLDSIAFQNGSIKFKATDREDIEYPSSNTLKPGKLSEIIVRDRAGKRIKRYLFQYSYFNNDATISGRLKLDTITEFGSSDQDVKPPYQFTYFNPNNLPSKYAINNIDHWGYYNGANNTTLLPPIASGVFGVTGADRNPASAQTLKTGVLSSIVYPTGGSTHFDFESHDYANLKGEQRFKLVPASEFVYSAPSYIYPVSKETQIFELTDTIAVTFDWSYEKADENAADLMNVETVYGEVRNVNTGQVFIGFSNMAYCGSNSPSGYCNVTSDFETYVMLPGTYVMSVRFIQGYITRANASWSNKVPIVQREGGGIRIKSITNYDSNTNLQNNKPALVRKFYYTEDENPGGKSVGRLILQPQYAYGFTLFKSNFSCNYIGDYLARMSNSVYPMGLSSKGTIVGYDKVTEVIGEKGEGGKNVYYFHNAEDYQDPETYPGVPTYSYPLVGKMAVAATFDSANVLLKKVDYIYQTKETFNLKGVKLFGEPNLSSGGATGVDYRIKFYDSASSWNVLSAEEERTYSPGGTTIVIIKKNYYDNPSHKEITRQQFQKSDGSTVIKKYKYPGDYTAAGSSSFVAQMKLKHIISPVVEEQTLLKRGTTTKLIAGSFTEFKLYNNKFYKPGLIYKLENSQPLADTTESTISTTNQLVLHAAYQPEVYFDNYTALGNIAQYHQPHDNSQAYLWGYNNTYPVAEVKNTTPDKVAYTSFENTQDQGNWSFDHPNTSLVADGVTGSKCLYFNPVPLQSVTKSAIPPGEYILSFWVKGVYPTVAGDGVAFSTGTDGPVNAAGWRYFDRKITITSPGNLRIHCAGGYLDELRLYPVNAQMTTYTYDPLVGMTSSTDANSYTTYYVYDALGRLSLVKDAKGNILKKHEYKYANQ